MKTILNAIYVRNFLSLNILVHMSVCGGGVKAQSGGVGGGGEVWGGGEV